MEIKRKTYVRPSLSFYAMEVQLMVQLGSRNDFDQDKMTDSNVLDRGNFGLDNWIDESKAGRGVFAGESWDSPNGNGRSSFTSDGIGGDWGF